MTAPAAQVGRATGTAPMVIDAAAPASNGEAFAEAADRLMTFVRQNVSPGEGEGPGLERLLCLLCLSCEFKVPVARLATALPEGTGPLDVHGLMAAMANLGFHATLVPAALARAPHSAPLLLEGGRAGPHVVRNCPETGRRTVVWPCGRMETLAPGAPPPKAARAWIFRYGQEHDPVGKMRRGHARQSWFRALLALHAAPAMTILGCTVALALSALVIPLFTIYAYTQIVSLGASAPLPGFIAGAVLVIVVEALLLAHRGRMIAFVANRLEYLVATASMERVLKIRAALSETLGLTDQVARLKSFDNVRGFLTSPSFSGMIEAPASVASLIAIMLLGGWIVIVPLGGIAAHLAVFALARRSAIPATRTSADHSTEMQRLAIDTFEKREEIRDAGIAHVWSARIADALVRQQSAMSRLRMVGAWGKALSAFVVTATAMLLLGAGAQAAWQGVLGSGAFLAITMLGLRALAPFHMLCLSIQRIEQVKSSVAQLNQLMEMEPEHDTERYYAPMEALCGAVTFVNTGHRTGDTRPVFMGLDLEVAPGTAVAITGGTGSGKTLILKMIQGMTDISIGTVRIDGIDLRQLPLDELRRRIGYVPQRPRLFAGSLRDNLLLANPLASDDKIAQVLAWTGLAEDLAVLDGGLDRERGTAEIAVFPQRFLFKFALAQALLVGSRLILLDALPNAVLDGEVGDVVRRIIGLSKEGCTIFYATQRSDFLPLADRIVSLQYGKAPLVTVANDHLAESA